MQLTHAIAEQRFPQKMRQNGQEGRKNPGKNAGNSEAQDNRSVTDFPRTEASLRTARRKSDRTR